MAEHEDARPFPPSAGEAEIPPRLADFLRKNKDAVVRAWEQAVREVPAARPLARPRLIDHVPELLDRMAEAVERDVSDAAAGEQATDLHALERLDEGFDLGEVTREYAILRECLIT